MRGVKRLFLVSILMLLASGCTSRFVYNNADWWINWYVDDYVSFSRYQQRQFDQFLGVQLDWHRDQELPRYEQFLAEAIRDLEPRQQIDAPYVQNRFDQGKAFWRDFMQRAVPGVEGVFTTLDDKQVNDFIANLQKEQEKLETEFAEQDKSDWLAERQESMYDTLKPWFGRFDDQQQARIQQWANSLNDIYADSLIQRKRWQDQFEQVMSRRDDRPYLRQQLFILLASPDELWSQQYQQALEENSQKTYLLIADLYNSASSKQRKRILKRANGYLKNIRKLQG